MNEQITQKIDQARQLLREASDAIIPKDTLECPEREAMYLLAEARGLADEAALALEQE